MKKQKESFYVKFIKYLYNINDNFDEYKRSEVNRIGNNAFMFLIVYFWLETMSFVVLVFSSFDLTDMLSIIFFSNALILFIIMSYISFSIYKLKLDHIDAYDDMDYHLKLKKLKRKSIFMSLIFFIIERLSTFYLDYSYNTDNLSLIQLIFSPRANINWFIGAVSVGFIYYFRTKSKINK
ncbi:DUF3278 domain-containing protein [Apilactobacillus micheneri]|uniref:DUF3278 domain-containing protein n=1 Tax=Apilactobacillus micheneri TaxID=1899430 RepID=UPI000D03E910|nr:DUF3278 domain-containing protein [Apilactobacillus micheneri]TPR37744.1 DUF3278 domain-containing protein [Apilactobacillus micheneri]TPR39056.1 DUF3278 domain-containing protein [Apilactobacillus micheneri]